MKTTATKNIAAFTATSYEGYYPPYISINEVDGRVEISVRSAEKDGSEGSYATITLNKYEFASLAGTAGSAANKKQIDAYGLALMMIREGCANPVGVAATALGKFATPSPDERRQP